MFHLRSQNSAQGGTHIRLSVKRCTGAKADTKEGRWDYVSESWRAQGERRSRSLGQPEEMWSEAGLIPKTRKKTKLINQ